jgi:hypothetical protein
MSVLATLREKRGQLDLPDKVTFPGIGARDRYMNSERSNGKTLPVERCGLVLLALNFIGAVSYVLAASRGGWVDPRLREWGLHSLTGEPYIWAINVLPMWAAFLVLNLIWGGFVAARRQWGSGIWWLATIPVWLAAMVIDFTHH